MDRTRIATVAGAAAAALAMLPLDARAATPASALFQPIPNAAAGDARAVRAEWRHHRWRRSYGRGDYAYGYGYRRPYWWYRHHHHHHRYYYDRDWY